ncbi:hypothetical protein IQ266_18100 [filamentous cyanobacterium LEGE 11480]|uniref:Uncharacterized protein n=1 Tax=Romeriopsis navalis LEGE 11480 TaxID=2777977 RepID=A0A928VN43_9CYAN|nr:hypothetical protein [Romeriopsis navalis]MBE9031648.1 hypothetical protein [Romeriopsis navalis LEGE 11480]
MRRQSIVLLAGVAGLFAVGCTIGEDANDVTTNPSPEADTPVAAQPFDQPLVSQKPDGEATEDGKEKADRSGNKVAGLLKPTDPEERAKLVQAAIRSRAGLDPFASLPPITTFNTPVESRDGGFGSGGRSTSFGSGGGSRSGRTPLDRLVISRNNNRRNNKSTGLGTGKGQGNVPKLPSFPDVIEIRRPQPPLIARGPSATTLNPNSTNPGLKPLPKIPEPTLAKAVEVTGVVTIGGLTKAIIKAPNEPTGRHVEVGQRLSNGQVLVKRIEANAGSDPIVVLEENGVEVSRGVGEAAIGKPAA